MCMDKEKVKSLVNEAIRKHYEKMFDYIDTLNVGEPKDNMKEMLNSLEYRRYIILNAIDAEGEHCARCGKIDDTVGKIGYGNGKSGIEYIYCCKDCK